MQSFEEFRTELIALLPRLRAFGRALADDQARADDLVHMACDTALKNFALYPPTGRLDAFMLHLMREGAGDLLSAPHEGYRAPAINDGSPEKQAMARALAALPPEEREVLLLVVVEGMRYREAAEALELPTDMVMRRLARGRKTLAALIHPAPASRRRQESQ